MWWPQVTRTLLPADCEIHASVDSGGSIAVDDTGVSLQRCLLADGPGGLYVRDSGSARLEGCEFVRNVNDTHVWSDSFLYTDNPASSLSMGCDTCDASQTYGPVLPLASAPAGEFLSGNDTAFVVLQLVRSSPCHHHSFTPAPFIASHWSPSGSDRCMLLLCS
jgi:hypothetical protein